MPSRAVMSVDEARAWLAEVISGAERLRLEAVDDDRVVSVTGPDCLELRLDGTISGPAMFWAMDLTGFVAVTVLIGPTPAMVLAHSSISFLEPAEPGELRVTAEVIKLASRSAVVQAHASDRRGTLVAASTLHFALPSRATRAALRTGQAVRAGS
ncbi:PaaI family thioesterase [Micromonospora sp. WMMD708]|uniref:PaaI family thioesterase n=1 Tax=Micromonospora sp. WMMD708 TaxID=3403464 RepID=UPI003BF5F369